MANRLLLNAGSSVADGLATNPFSSRRFFLGQPGQVRMVIG